MEFLGPGFLLAAPLALLLWLGPLAARDARHGALRTAAVLLVVLALARPVTRTEDPSAHQVVVLDRTESVTAEASAAAADAVRSLAEGLETGATLHLIDVAPAGAEDIEVPGALRIDSNGSTPLAAALDAAARSIPAGAGRAGVALLTDGLATDDPSGADRLHAAADLAARGVPVALAALPGPRGDLRAVGLDLAGPARVGREATALARLVGGGQVVRLALFEGEVELASLEDVAVDGDVLLPLPFTPRASGFLDLRLAVEVTDGVDPRGGDLVFERCVPVDDPLRVAYLGARVQGAPARLGDLLGDGFEITSDGVEGADVVLLDDRPARSVPAERQQSLANAVAEGRAGLVMAGGEASFGPGGYHEEPLEELLPVEFVQKEEKRDPSTTLVVIIDTSGSMGGNRVQLAKEVSRLAIRRLLPHDKVGLVEFYGAKRWAVPIQPASNSIEIERALNRLDAGGGTVILPAIEEAYYGLKNVRTRYKHVLILTDGGVETGAFEPLLRRMADDGMNVSTVLIGPDAHSEFLVNIANWGQGRFYSVPNRFNLPEILLKQPASAKLPAYRPQATAVRARGGASWWGEIERGELPDLDGYVETRARPGAEVIVETAEESHPVLATWRYGAGRVTAMTTEPTGPGTESWSRWDGYGELLGRVLERTAADDAAPFRFFAAREPGGARIVAEATGDPRAAGTPEALMIQGDGERELGLVQVAPDRWQTHVEWRGDAALRVEGRSAGSAPRRLVLGATAGGARELQVAPEALDALAESLGATPTSLEALGATGVPIAELEEPTRRRLREWAPLLALLALLAYLGDVAYRRWPRAARV